MIIRGRNYLRIIKRRRKTKRIKRPILKRIAKFKKLIRRKLLRAVYKPKPKSSKRKQYLSKCYFSRYILPKRRLIYKATIGSYMDLNVYYQDESRILINLRQDLIRQEINKMRYTIQRFKSSYIPLSKRSFYFGRVYFSHKRRNTFITINKTFEETWQPYEQVVFKSSCGLIGYLGPKRPTYHARLDVVKSASAFLAKECFTSVDITFSSGLSRTYRRFIKVLCENHFYVRYLISLKRRSHGHTRKKKLKRL